MMQNTIMFSILAVIATVIVCFVVSTFLPGIERKYVHARIQQRIGPPVTSPGIMAPIKFAFKKNGVSSDVGTHLWPGNRNLGFGSGAAFPRRVRDPGGQRAQVRRGLLRLAQCRVPASTSALFCRWGRRQCREPNGDDGERFLQPCARRGRPALPRRWQATHRAVFARDSDATGAGV